MNPARQRLECVELAPAFGLQREFSSSAREENEALLLCVLCECLCVQFQNAEDAEVHAEGAEQPSRNQRFSQGIRGGLGLGKRNSLILSRPESLGEKSAMKMILPRDSGRAGSLRVAARLKYSSPLANDFDCCSAEGKKDLASASFANAFASSALK
jgi:hypothetical protein